MKITGKEVPYPEVNVERKNIEYAKMLLQDYAGTVSEDTAIHLYSYQEFLQSGKWEEFANILKKIAIVEMFHLELLGETILKLGLNPIYATFDSENDNIKYWISENVDYTDDLKKMLKADIKAETAAIEQYEIHKKLINDKYIKVLLERLIKDEEEHLIVFKELYNIVDKK